MTRRAFVLAPAAAALAAQPRTAMGVATTSYMTYARPREPFAFLERCAALGAGAIYGIAPSSRNGESACPGAAALAEELSPLARGDVAGLNVA